jgi:hypothetical protein
LSFGALFLLWATTSGFVAVMDQISRAYGVKEERSFLKARGLRYFSRQVFSFGRFVFRADCCGRIHPGLDRFTDGCERTLARGLRGDSLVADFPLSFIGVCYGLLFRAQH